MNFAVNSSFIVPHLTFNTSYNDNLKLFLFAWKNKNNLDFA
jgi:hypothetical protein